MIALFLPSPSHGVWHLGPFPIRAYALCIIAGVFAAIWLANKRWIARGGHPGEVADMAIYAVPFGLVGGRIYHVITDHELYFGDGRNPWRAFAIWEGGLGIWGAIPLGALGAWLYCRRQGISMRTMMDAVAPALLLAQAIGRWGNYFNQELFGRPTTAAWALKIDPEHRPPGYENFATFHPTFLYECLWNLGAMGLVLWLDHRFKLGYARVFALYVMCYTAGRGWIENLRIDPVELDDVAGLRWNVWMSLVLFVAALAYFVWATLKHPGREAAYRFVVTDEDPDQVEETTTDPSQDQLQKDDHEASADRRPEAQIGG